MPRNRARYSNSNLLVAIKPETAIFVGTGWVNPARPNFLDAQANEKRAHDQAVEDYLIGRRSRFNAETIFHYFADGVLNGAGETGQFGLNSRIIHELTAPTVQRHITCYCFDHKESLVTMQGKCLLSIKNSQMRRWILSAFRVILPVIFGRRGAAC